MSMFIPKQINVGYQERKDTYTNKLAYVIYFDEKGVLRKEKSWEGWRDKNIQNDIFENVPTSGFVLNKTAGGDRSHWNTRATYSRIYDPRGFEFEITIDNLLFILENTNSIKGKGLEGEFVYSWNGADLVLLPTSSPDYEDITAYSMLINNKTNITAKDLKIGALYNCKGNEKLVFLGKSELYSTVFSWSRFQKVPNEALGKAFFFYDIKNNSIRNYKSISGRVLALEEERVSNYLEILDMLETDTSYQQCNGWVFEDLTYEEMLEEIQRAINVGYNGCSFNSENKTYTRQYDSNTVYSRINGDKLTIAMWNNSTRESDIYEFTYQEFYDMIKPLKKVINFNNGKKLILG